MAIPKSVAAATVVALLAAVGAPSVYRLLTVHGAFRSNVASHVNDASFVTVADTPACEDLHHHLPSNKLFAACEESYQVRFSWFPPLLNFKDPELASKSRASIHVIDPETRKSTKLRHENFEGPFISHGIDVISDPDRPDEAVFIFAVNHPPDPDYVHQVKFFPGLHASQDGNAKPKAQSQVELFHHLLGSPTIRHVRSIRHPLITTPNDLRATSPTSFFVTNDHHYREGLYRSLEDIYPGATWSNTIHVDVLSSSATDDPESGLNATVALTGLHNNNGLGQGRSSDEIAIGSAASARLHIGRLHDRSQIRIVESVDLDTTIDNPSYFTDPLSARSGFVLAGLQRSIDLERTRLDPQATNSVVVWHVTGGQDGAPWEKKLLFQDDGSRIRTSSAAVLVADQSTSRPTDDGKGRKAWLFVTGFLSRNMIAVKVDISADRSS